MGRGLITRIEARTISPRTSGALCNVFARWLARDPALADAARSGLAAIADATEDPILRARALRLGGP